MSDKRERILAYAWTLAFYYSLKNYAVSREVGLPCLETAKNHVWTKQRADFVAVNKRHEVVIVETKSCWSDFATDHKWQHYVTLQQILLRRGYRDGQAYCRVFKERAGGKGCGRHSV